MKTIFAFIVLSIVLDSLMTNEMGKKDHASSPRVYSKKKLNPFLMPYIMWMPYRENRKKQQNNQKLDAAMKVEDQENDMIRERKKIFAHKNALFSE